MTLHSVPTKQPFVYTVSIFKIYNIVCWQWVGCILIRRYRQNADSAPPFQSMSYHALELLADAAWMDHVSSTNPSVGSDTIYVRKVIKRLTRESEVPVWAPFSAWWERGEERSRGGADAAKGSARLPRWSGAFACDAAAHVHAYLRFVLLWDSSYRRFGGLNSRRNEIMSWHRYDTRCGEFWWEPAEFCSGIVGFCKRHLTWIAIGVDVVLGADLPNVNKLSSLLLELFWRLF